MEDRCILEGEIKIKKNFCPIHEQHVPLSQSPSKIWYWPTDGDVLQPGT